ncbi:unnamed protein product [Polarella glacialis]|uniref:Methyltransferase FkbM domain-containing protein n=1 Tax=Polarella glacialis TaxID=89957 RepID=A0A813D1B3_POLGL|nr:unnamed protein product [Polarella glacialis]
MIEADTRFRPHLEAVGDAFEFHLLGEQSSTPATFFSTTADVRSGASIHREISSAYAPGHVEELQMTAVTLDSLLLGGLGFDLIKLDTQGSELAILRGGSLLIRKAEFLLLEVSLLPLIFRAPSFEDVILGAKHLGFKLVDFCRSAL